MTSPMPSTSSIATATLAASLAFLFFWRLTSTSRLPGSVGANENVPISLRKAAMSRRGVWEVFDDLAKKYGTCASTLLQVFLGIHFVL